jgi:hypothetical protein
MLPTSMNITGNFRLASPASENIETHVNKTQSECELFYTAYIAEELNWPGMDAPFDSGTTIPAYASCDHARWRATFYEKQR